MTTKIYELEEKLKMATVKNCSPAEVNAIEHVIKQGKKLPDGIYKNKSGVYRKYESNALDESEKQKIVEYETLLQLRRLTKLMYILVALTAILVAFGIRIVLK